MSFGLVKHNNNSISAITSAGSLGTGKMVLLQTQNASSSSSISFTSNIDSTYSVYVFKFINMHPNGDVKQFQFQADTGTNTNYNLNMVTSNWVNYNDESDASRALTYQAGNTQANGTSFQHLGISTGNDNDQSMSGELYVFAPSSSTFNKHFFSRTSTYTANNHCYDTYSSGYFNTATPITRFNFKYTGDTIDSGTIKLYGLQAS
tara:strand:+ start:477 stop:1091 length:615 start_codon:yes stop_codon:yes gene_type:complete